MNIDSLFLEFVSCCDHEFLHFGENGLTYLIELIAFHGVVEVAFLHQILDIHFELGISR